MRSARAGSSKGGTSKEVKTMIKNYDFNVYSCKGVEQVTLQTSYKPLWQLRQELEQEYKKVHNIKTTVIVDFIQEW